MGLPSFNTQDRSFSLLQSKWASQLDPLLANPMAKGVFLKDISLSVGDNVIDHKLQRELQGYIVTDMFGTFSQLYRKQSDMPTLNFILNSSANTVVSILVY